MSEKYRWLLAKAQMQREEVKQPLFDKPARIALWCIAIMLLAMFISSYFS